MNYQLVLVVSTESEEKAEELLHIAKDAVIDSLDLEKEDFIAAAVRPE